MHIKALPMLKSLYKTSLCPQSSHKNGTTGAMYLELVGCNNGFDLFIFPSMALSGMGRQRLKLCCLLLFISTASPRKTKAAKLPLCVINLRGEMSSSDHTVHNETTKYGGREVGRGRDGGGGVVLESLPAQLQTAVRSHP